MMKLTAALCGVLISTSLWAADASRRAQMSMKPTLVEDGCIGSVCRADCRYDGTQRYENCSVYCKATGAFLRQCNTGFNCPLPC